MTIPAPYQFNPELDLKLERVVDVPRELVWKAWTTPEHLMKWFAPRPYETIDCEIDLRPGGMFRSTMRSPEGEEFPGTGCYLEVVEIERLTWTNLLLPGYRPGDPSEDLPFTAVISMEDAGNGTKYTALAIHGDPAVQKKHAEMGFQEGWGMALDQLVEVAKSM